MNTAAAIGTHPSGRVTPASRRLMSPALVLVFIASVGGDVSFYLLLTVVPQFASTLGADGVGAGLATAALMFSSVVAELAAPAIIARVGYRVAFGGGLFLLGAPALALAVLPSVAAVIAVSLLRGLGFGLTVVAGGALAATLVPAERRGEGLGLYGLVVGVPAIVALPMGVWLVGQVGFAPVFVGGAVSSLVVVLAALGLPSQATDAIGSAGVAEVLRRPAIGRIALVFAGTAAAAGVVVTFVPVATEGAQDLATAALLVQAMAATVARWVAGRHGDRFGSARLLGPGLITAAIGVASLLLVGSPAAVLLGMALFGIGFGISQNATLVVMYGRVAPSDFGAVSAVWSVAYDGALGVGAAIFGVLASQVGYPTAFVVTSVTMLFGLLPLWHDRRSRRSDAVEVLATQH